MDTNDSWHDRKIQVARERAEKQKEVLQAAAEAPHDLDPVAAFREKLVQKVRGHTPR